MNVLYLFGPEPGRARHARPRDLRVADARRDHGRASTARGASAATSCAWRQSDHEGELVGWLLAARAERRSTPSCSTPGRSRTTPTRCATRSRRCGAPGDRGAHVEHRRTRGVPTHLGRVRCLPGHDQRPRGRWLSSGAGGDAVDHRVRRRRAGRAPGRAGCRRVARHAAAAHALPHRLHGLQRTGARASRRRAVPHRRPLHGAVAPRGPRPGAASRITNPLREELAGLLDGVAPARVRGRGRDRRRRAIGSPRRSATTSSSSRRPTWSSRCAP